MVRPGMMRVRRRSTKNKVGGDLKNPYLYKKKIMTNQSHRDFLTSVAMEFDTTISLADVDSFLENASVEDGADLEVLMQIWATSEDASDIDLDELECLIFNVADKGR